MVMKMMNQSSGARRAPYILLSWPLEANSELCLAGASLLLGIGDL